MLEESEKRNHKILGPKLGLFMFHDTAPGMPYWLPNGVKLFNELVNFWRVEHEKHNYQEIMSPLINKSDLWKISGHWDHYKEDMFIADMGENEQYGIKPMNCPNAMVVFDSKQVSYKDLPLRLSDTDRLHRYERSGTLNGLLRVRSFQQDDSHNFISEDMIESEYQHIFELCEKFYGIFDMEYSFRLGTRPEKFMGDPESWDKAESALKSVLEKSSRPYKILEGDGAFYGPKVDILMKDAIGREWQMGTIQLDYQIPKNFDLKYTDKDGTKKTPVVVHRVIYGSLERFIGILIEHFAGAFPLWLSPVQLVVIPIADRHEEYAQKFVDSCKEHGIRVELDNRSERLQAKVRDHEIAKHPYVVIVGDKEIETQTVSVRSRSTKEVGLMKSQEFIDKLLREIENKGK
jgi:threonyl-tRNA synthetase